ncbi:RNB domain-containing ribonuclease [bacterium]|nr:MAG: RNB domain-containing ribonuclease [bacterium]
MPLTHNINQTCKGQHTAKNSKAIRAIFENQIRDKENRIILQKIARQAMLDKGFIPDFPAEVIAEINNLRNPLEDSGQIPDLRHLLWCSIDNDDSRDLDQLSVAVPSDNGNIKILVAIADVDSYVKKGSAIDRHAQHNTTTVYTSAEIFSMLPEILSTDLTSLNYNTDRLAIIFEMLVAEDGSVNKSDIYRGLVRNYAKLAYNSTSKWLDKTEEAPENIKQVKGLEENIRQQYVASLRLKKLRDSKGALKFERIQSRPIFNGDKLEMIKVEKTNSSKEMIENFMVSVNGISARYLNSKNFPSVRRVVRKPKRWNRIVEIALAQGYTLVEEPNSKELDNFLIWAKAKNPSQFADLSLSIIKLLGPGEYVVEIPGGESMGHFALGVKDYSHSTAPNRRYPDVLTQRLLKACIADKDIPYQAEELMDIAQHCTEMENLSKKVERQVEKSTYIILLEERIGEVFEAIVTGASNKATWLRLMNPPVEGRLINPSKGIDVGDILKVRLVDTDLELSHIDFEEIN